MYPIPLRTLTEEEKEHHNKIWSRYDEYVKYDYEIHKDYNGKGLQGDTIDINAENKSYNVIFRNGHKIVGTLLLNSKVKYGVYKDKFLYLFKPSVANYPDFYVASKYENETENKYVYIEFAEWNNYLRGNVIDYIGTVGTKEGEYTHLKYLNELNGIKEIKFPKSKIIEDKESDEEFQNSCKLSCKLNQNLFSKKDQKKKYIYQLFSIDPIGCKDIDDAFHFKVLDEKNEIYEIGVHISYTWTYFKKHVDKYFEIFSQRMSTFYDYNKNINMIPKEYAEDLCSLLEKKYRNVLSTIFVIKKGKIVSSDIKLKIGYIMKNYDYDSVNKLYDTYENNDKSRLSTKESMLVGLMEVSKSIFKTDCVKDSHKLVEYWMLCANCVMAKKCVRKYGYRTILRIQEGKKIKEQIEHENINENMDSTLKNFLNIYYGEAAEYRAYHKKKINIHYNINEFLHWRYNYYTHCTSPIRRFCDMFIQGLYTQILPSQLKDHQLNTLFITTKMNDLNKNMKKYQNQSKILDLLFKYVDKEEYIIDSSGYIIEMDGEKNVIKVYFPEFGFILKRRIIDSKFKHITEIEEDKNKYIIEIGKKEEDNYEYESYELYKKYNLKIYLFPKKYVLQERMIFIF